MRVAELSSLPAAAAAVEREVVEAVQGKGVATRRRREDEGRRTMAMGEEAAETGRRVLSLEATLLVAIAEEGRAVVVAASRRRRPLPVALR